MKSSNIGGQAVMEGVMMMNKDRYSVAVRRPDGEIEVKVEQHKPLTKHKGLLKVPLCIPLRSMRTRRRKRKSRRRKRKRSSRKRKKKRQTS